MTEPQVIFSHSTHPDAAHDMAQPTSVAIPCKNISDETVYLLKSVGGLTKLEHVAAMVAGGYPPSSALSSSGETRERQLQWIADYAVDQAYSILAECAKRQAPKPASPIEVAG